MTREEAIKYLIHPIATSTAIGEEKQKEFEAYNMAIEVLSTNDIQGEWVDEDGNNVPLHKDGYPLRSCYCNQCHEWLVASDEYNVKGNFCPNCGAIMKGGAE